MARIYLAPDDEITSVVEKLKNAEGVSAVLVVPKNATLMQSVINVRLIKKKALELGKTLGIVTTDAVSRHLASQVGLAVYATVEDVPNRDKVPTHKESKAILTNEEEVIVEEKADKTVILQSGVPVHSYERKTHTDNSTTRFESIQSEEKKEPLSEIEPANEIAETLESSHEHVAPVKSETILNDESVVVGQKFEYEEASAHHQTHALRPPRRQVVIPRFVSKLALVLIVVVLLGGVVAAAYFPTAEVILHVPTESTKKSISLLIDASASTSESTTIASIKHDVVAEGNGQVRASGKKPVGDKAKGIVTVSNSWSTDTEKLAKNTEIISGDKTLSFRTVSDVTIAGATVSLVGGVATISAGKTDVAVIADQPGDQYNIGPSKFAIQGLSSGKSSKITGASSANMSGGTTKELVVVAEADIVQARESAKKSAEEAAKTNLKNAFPASEIMLDKTIVITTIADDPNHAVGDEVETVTILAKASAIGYGALKTDIENALKNIFQDGLAESKAVILPDITTIEWDVKAKDDGKYELAKEIEGQIIAVIDTGAVRKSVARKLKSTVSANLQDKFSAESAEVIVSPKWWPLMPLVRSRISVKTVE